MRTLITILLLINTAICFSQENETKRIFLPKDELFRSIRLDPIECQSFGSLLYYWEGSRPQDKLYVPFAIGFHKSIMRWEKTEDRSYEIEGEVASFTQFEYLINDDGVWQRDILNTDFKVGLMFNYQIKNYTFRCRIYHLSSHWGDDFIFNNKMKYPVPNPVNYELLDITASVQKKYVRYYAGIGIVPRPVIIRKRFAAEAGAYFCVPVNERQNIKYAGGADIKIFEQNNFTPGCKFGLGLELGKTEKNPFTVMIEYYNGHMPYSYYEYKLVQFLGMGLYFDPI